ncbi:glycoside hydrolase family 38 C-terminal domain-containing protein [Sunxiuqinia sp. A32]|uniref:glycoside hydrolase family 38 N-terminal domain-containing protein n=1 Tax=Sunxiuqinia sp. A32 TaxID=3461496 RepID=UPI00404588A3
MSKLKTLLILSFVVCFIGGYAQTKTVYMVADAHLDTQWDWTVETTIDEYVKNTLTQNFALFEKYPNYIFNFEGAIKYMWAKEYYPDLYERLKGYVASGQWNICGSSLDANDVIVPSAESLIRNILIGQTFYKREFGVKSNDIFLPDCFGFGYTLPTVAAHCGLLGFSTQKLSWGGVVTPFKLGVWQGVDGSKIMAAPSGGAYVYGFSEDLSYNGELMNWANEVGDQTGHYDAFRYFGVGDRGGAPTSETVSWLEKSLVGDGPLNVECVTSDYLFKKYSPESNPEFPVYDGELLMTTHGTGCYTSQTMMKRWNRKNELLADAAEKSSVIADWMGGLSYQYETLNNAWIKLLWHQFHDDLTGTSVPKAYTYSWNDEVIVQNMFSNVLSNAVGAGVRSLDTQVEGTPIVVYNPLAIDREDVVEVELPLSEKSDYISVFDKDGKELPAQVISSDENSIKFIFTAKVQSLGYEVYDVRPSSAAPEVSDDMKITENTLENSVYKVMIDGNGDVSSIIDKMNGNKELLAAPIRLALFYNMSTSWPSWEIYYTTINGNPKSYIDGTPEINIVENGPVRISLKIKREKEGSTFIQYIRLTNSGSNSRIDFENDVDWQSGKTLLKAVFPLAVSNPEATYDLGIGAIKRPNNTSKQYEVPAQQWADITAPDDSYGVSILNDCKYGWDKPSNNTLRLSLIHTPGITDRYTYQGSQDLGNNKFTFSVYGHSNSCFEAGSTTEASKLNQPLLAFATTKHEGDLGKSFSMVKVDSPQVALKAFKRAENNDDYVVRFYETQGETASNVKVKFASKIISAKELNGIEEEIGSVDFSDSTLTINMTAFQPKTYSVQLAPPVKTMSAPNSKSVELDFNADVITTQENMQDGNFDSETNSYAAELIPEIIEVDGINFEIGSKEDGAKNAVRCDGSTITLPSHEGYKKLYLLAASSNTDGSEASFYVDGTPYDVNVEYYSNNIGQATQYSILAPDTTIRSNYFKKENIAWTGTHRHNGDSNKDEAYVFTYMFKYCLEIPESAGELVLPDDEELALFAVSLSDNENDDTFPVTELVDIQKKDSIRPPVVPVYCGDNLSNGKSAVASGQTGDHERADLACDGDDETKWCQVYSGAKWLEVDLGQEMEICEWRIRHAGIENTGYITKDFKLQRKDGNSWIDVDVVTGNTLNTTDRKISPVSARYVRLYITNSGSDDAARIYGFQVFGGITTGLDLQKKSSSNKASIKVYPNPVTSDSMGIELTGFGDKNVDVSITSLSGKRVYQSNFTNAPHLEINKCNFIDAGVYIVMVSGETDNARSKVVFAN